MTDRSDGQASPTDGVRGRRHRSADADLLGFVALSLLPISHVAGRLPNGCARATRRPWRSIDCSRRGGRDEPRRPIGAAGGRGRGAGARRRPRPHADRVERRGVSGRADGDRRSAAGAVDARIARGAGAAGRRHRRIARGVAVRARRSPSGSPPIWPRAASRSSAGWRAASIPRRIAARWRPADRRSRCSGAGADIVYPTEHAALAREIEPAGLISASSSPARRRSRSSFRSATGSSAGCRARSSSSRRGRRAGRSSRRAARSSRVATCWPCPGNVLSGRNRGGHALLRDGAKIVEARTISWRN